MNAEEAKQVLFNEKKERATRCSKEIDDAVQRNFCILDAQLLINQAGSKFNYQVVPQENPSNSLEN